MNTPSSCEKPLCKRQQNGDRTNDSSRPLKKARFAWQVKGKYHLKNATSEIDDTSIFQSEGFDEPCSSNRDPNDLVGNTKQNLEIIGDCLLKQDFTTLNSVISNNDKSVLPDTSTPNKMEYPKYISSHSKPTGSPRKSTKKSNSSVPISMVFPHGFTEDECIDRWQALQMVKCIMDNTINKALDSWMMESLPVEVDNNQFIALNVAEFTNNLSGDNSVENEGILMAIEAHGLQNTSSSSSCSDDVVQCNSSSPKCEPHLSPLRNQKQLDPSIGTLCNNSAASNNLDMSWLYSEKTATNDMDNVSPLDVFPNTRPFQYFYEIDNHQAPSIGYDDLNNVVDNHYDFLDTAVSFAIQNKGLTSSGTN